MPVLVIEDGVVVQAYRDVDETADAIEKYHALSDATLVVGDHPPGTLFDGSVFTAPDVPARVPETVTKLQLKRALDGAGQWTNFKAALAADSDAAEDWDLAVTIARNDASIAAVAAALSLDETAIDVIFITAETL